MSAIHRFTKTKNMLLEKRSCFSLPSRASFVSAWLLAANTSLNTPLHAANPVSPVGTPSVVHARRSYGIVITRSWSTPYAMRDTIVAPATRMKCPVPRTLGGKIFPIASLDLGLLELECGDPDRDMIRERRRASARGRARGAF